MPSAEPYVPLISFIKARQVFRGLSEEQLQRLKRQGYFTPRQPLGATAESITLLQPGFPMDHVLEAKRNHFESFSLQLGTATWYATSGGKKDGYVVTVALPLDIYAVIEGGSAPVAYGGSDGTQWVDPRHLNYNAGLFDWSRMRSRAITDQEVLLAAGKGFPARIYRASRDQASARFAPWAVTGERYRFV
jgi:hypothetical protein